MSRSLRVGSRIAVAVVTLLTSAIAASPATSTPISDAAAPPSAQVFPTPRAFVSALDLECFKTAPYVPPNVTITTRHINPVLAGLPIETHVLGERSQLCVPVAKNNVIPPAAVLNFIRWVDLSCYRISGQAVNFPLSLRHLNPVLAGQPIKNTVMAIPTQLCLPVIKNNVMPPAEVLSLVRHIDLKCYIVGNQARLGVNLAIRQLNPVLGNVPQVPVTVREARQLCVPVIKNNIMPPADVFNVVRWVDMEKYDTTGIPLPAPITLQLRHINPLLGNLPPETVTIQNRDQLMLPVAKNNAIPPG